MKYKITFKGGVSEVVTKESFSDAWSYARSKGKTFSIESVNG
jgi:hypothetical protein